MTANPVIQYSIILLQFGTIVIRPRPDMFRFISNRKSLLLIEISQDSKYGLNMNMNIYQMSQSELESVPAKFLSQGFKPLLVAQSDTNPIGTSIMKSSLEASNEVNSAGSKQITFADDSIDNAASIEKFLSRRVKIFNASWEVGELFNVSLSPWTAWYNNPSIRDKIANYTQFKCDLKLTFYINGTPFHYGYILVNWNYYNKGNAAGVSRDRWISGSQRPHLFLNPTTSKGGEMTIPFFYPFNYYNTFENEPTLNEMGQLYLDSSGNGLQQINAGSAEVSITIFAEAVNIKLAAPTSVKPELVAQSEIVVPEMSPSVPSPQIVKNTPFPTLANVDAPTTTQTLTLSGASRPVNDNTVAGAPEENNTALSSFTKKESFYETVLLAPSAVSDTTFHFLRVAPFLESRYAVPGIPTIGFQYIPTSLSFACRCFNFWSGSLKFRFMIEASQYHRGRIAVIYEPHGSELGSSPYNTTYNTIIDLDDGRDFTLEVPWMQNRPYCYIRDTGLYEGSGNPGEGIPTDREYTNGTLFFKVLTQISVPDGVSNIAIHTFISGGDDFELRDVASNETLIRAPKVYDEAPTFTTRASDVVSLAADVASGMSFAKKLYSGKKKSKKSSKTTPSSTSLSSELVAQSEVLETTDIGNPESSMELKMAEVSGSTSDKLCHYYGEEVTDILQLCRRPCHYRTLGEDNVNAHSRLTYQLCAMPADPGPGPTSAPDRMGTELVAYNFANQTFLNYFRNCYAGWRGSIDWKFTTSIKSGYMSVTRLTNLDLTTFDVDYRPDTIVLYDPTHKPGRAAQVRNFGFRKSAAGSAYVDTSLMNALEVNIPFTYPRRFAGTRNYSWAADPDRVCGAPFSLEVGLSDANDFSCEMFVNAGDDFMFYGFTGAPIIYTQVGDQGAVSQN